MNEERRERSNYGKIAVSVVTTVLLLFLYGTIFSFSAQDAEESGSLSREVAEHCVEVYNVISGKQWTRAIVESWAAYWEHPIRKLAHFSEYACMGVLVYSIFRPWRERNRKLFLLVILWVAVSAATDEFHQLFVPGRSGNIADVLLDTCGGAFGLTVWVTLERIVESVLRRKSHSSSAGRLDVTKKSAVK